MHARIIHPPACCQQRVRSGWEGMLHCEMLEAAPATCRPARCRMQAQLQPRCACAVILIQHDASSSSTSAAAVLCWPVPGLSAAHPSHSDRVQLWKQHVPARCMRAARKQAQLHTTVSRSMGANTRDQLQTARCWALLGSVAGQPHNNCRQDGMRQQRSHACHRHALEPAHTPFVFTAHPLSVQGGVAAHLCMCKPPWAGLPDGSAYTLAAHRPVCLVPTESYAHVGSERDTIEPHHHPFAGCRTHTHMPQPWAVVVCVVVGPNPEPCTLKLWDTHPCRPLPCSPARPRTHCRVAQQQRMQACHQQARRPKQAQRHTPTADTRVDAPPSVCAPANFTTRPCRAPLKFAAMQTLL
ncbi:hypothetical protein COO60DRAFT_909046 [Scenedesmus sp. NREL 46B-D3]|nr:hypothetical protein COO60DRAFT_909046 [Scenedesmus sp. NREL 46B-D3]